MEELKKETEKWLKRAKEVRKGVEGDKDFLKNIDAYLSDTTYFLEKHDLIRAFEAVIWAWSWIEIGLQIGKLKRFEVSEEEVPK
jgi:hypothetical protein